VLLGAVFAGSVPSLLLIERRVARLRRFEAQLPEALDLIARSLRAGQALPSALQMVADEMAEPAGQVFARTCEEIRLGLSTPEALNRLSARMPSTDLGFFVIAVLIQRETGGNLAQVLGGISELIRERIKLISKVRALSAEGRISGVVLSLLPFATGCALYAIDEEFMSALWRDPRGLLMLKVAGVLLVMGGLWMRSLVRIRV
jgi:tight adherence protein B